MAILTKVSLVFLSLRQRWECPFKYATSNNFHILTIQDRFPISYGAVPIPEYKHRQQMRLWHLMTSHADTHAQTIRTRIMMLQ